MFWHCKSGFLFGILSVVFESGEVSNKLATKPAMTCGPSPLTIRSAAQLCSNGFERTHSIFASEGPIDLQPSGPSGLSADSHTWGCSSTSQAAASIPTWAWNYMVIESSNYSSPQSHPPKGRTHRQVKKGHWWSLWFLLSTAVAAAVLAATVLAAGSIRLTQSTLLAQHLLQGMLDGPLDHAFLRWKLSMKIDPETTAKLAKYRLNM